MWGRIDPASQKFTSDGRCIVMEKVFSPREGTKDLTMVLCIWWVGHYSMPVCR